jgi:hypothetical protein
MSRRRPRDRARVDLGLHDDPPADDVQPAREPQQRGDLGTADSTAS